MRKRSEESEFVDVVFLSERSEADEEGKEKAESGSERGKIKLKIILKQTKPYLTNQNNLGFRNRKSFCFLLVNS